MDEMNNTTENSTKKTVEIEQELWNRYTAGGTQDINERMWEIWEKEQEERNVEELKQKVEDLEPISREEAKRCKGVGDINGNRAMLAYIKGASVDGLSEEEMKVIVSQIYGQTSTYSILQLLKGYAIEIDGDYYFDTETSQEVLSEKQQELFESIKQKKEAKQTAEKNYSRVSPDKSYRYQRKAEELEQEIEELTEKMGEYNQIKNRIEDGEALGVEGWG